MTDAVALGSITKFASPPAPKKARKRRWLLLKTAKEMLPMERVSWCNSRLVWDKTTVDIWKMKVGGNAHYKNLQQCGSVWVCPVCSAKISMRRGAELSEGVLRSGLTGFLVTFTLQHNMGSDLDTLLDDLNGGVRFILSGMPARRFKDRFHIVGSVSDLEHTWSTEYGHHPHKHMLFLTDLSREEINRPEVREEINAYFSRYGHYLEQRGYLVNEHTVDLRTDRDSLEKYLTKWGLELEVTQGQQKEGRANHYSPFQLLDRITETEGKEKANLVKAFREYAKAFKGRKQLSYSKGLRERLQLVPEKSDTELVEEDEEPSYLFARLLWRQYKELLKIESTGVLGKVLDISSEGDLVDLWQFLESLGIEITEFQWEKALAINGPNWEELPP